MGLDPQAAPLAHGELLTTREVADLLRCSEATVRSFIRSGQLEAYKRGRTWLITRQSVGTFLLRGRNGESGRARGEG